MPEKGEEMEVLSKKVYVEIGKSFPRLFMSAKQLSEYEGMTSGYYRLIIREIEEQIAEGRYSKAAVSETDPKTVSYYVYRDYVANRRKLKNKNLKKTVKPYNPADVAVLCPLVREVMVVGD